jgi:anti-sigma regulatory factor (Ser/Thr protein kinase)
MIRPMMRTAPHAPVDTFRHEALMYAGDDGFLAGTLPFIRDGVAHGEPVLVVVDRRKVERLRAELDGDAEHVEFADMAAVGANPGRIIAAWRDFVDRHAASGRRLRGIGEPIDAGRRGAELVECHRHEELLNLAFADADGFWLVCPYDTEALDPDVVERAQTTHPLLRHGVASRDSGRYDREAPTAPASDPLPEPSTAPEELPVAPGALARARDCVRRHAEAAGLSTARRDDLLLAVTEAASNSIRHGGGHGVLRVWREPDALVCEMRDAGRLDQPLAGRLPPPHAHGGGYGLWLVNQVCDLVQLRSFTGGSVVRMHMRV